MRDGLGTPDFRRADGAYKGQPEGKVGMKVVQLWLCEPETPPSPDA